MIRTRPHVFEAFNSCFESQEGGFQARHLPQMLMIALNFILRHTQMLELNKETLFLQIGCTL